jgi:hypothetical protein
VIGGTTRPSTVDISATGVAKTLSIDQDLSSTSNQTLTAAGGITISGERTFTSTSGTINTASALSGNSSFTISGNADIDGAITGITTFSVSGTSNIGADVTTSSTQTYSGAVTLSANVNLTGTTVATNGTVAGGSQNLTVTGNAVFGDGTADTVTGVAVLDVTGNTTINTNTITTSSTQTYGDATSDTITIGTDTTLTTTNSQITFSGTVNSKANEANSLTLSVGSSEVQFDAVVGTGTNGTLGTIAITGALDLDAAIGSGATAGAGALTVLTTSNIGADITTTNDQTYTGAVTMSGGNRILRSNSGTINNQSTIAGGSANLTITGNLNSDGAISSTTVFSVSGTSDLGASVTTTSTQTYTSAVTISADVTLATTNSDITFSSTLDSASTAYKQLIVNVGSGTLTFADNVGTTQDLGELDLTAALIVVGGDITTDDSGSGDGTEGLTQIFTNYQYYGDNNALFNDYDDGSSDLNWCGTRSTCNSDTDATTVTSIAVGESGYDSYAFRWTGYFQPSALGTTTYYFSTFSDDASNMYLGTAGQSLSTFLGLVQSGSYNHSNATTYRVVTNNGAHGMNAATGSKEVTSGNLYPIAIYYGEQGGGDQMYFQWRQGQAVANSGAYTGTSLSGGQFYTDTPNNSSGDGTITFTGAVQFSADSTITSNDDDITFTSTIDSDGATARTVTINSGTGDTSVSGAIGGTNDLADITFTTAGLTAANIKSEGTIAVTNSAASSITGVISDGSSAASLTKAGAGTLTLSQEQILQQD